MNATTFQKAKGLALGPETGLAIHEVGAAAYRAFAKYHYQSAGLAPGARLFAIRRDRQDLGIVVYAHAGLGCRPRRLALPKTLWGGPLSRRVQYLKIGLRVLQRLVVLPDARGRGLAATLVANTLPLLGVPFVEAIARNPGVLQRAGMSLVKEGSARKAPSFKEWCQSHGSHLRGKDADWAKFQVRYLASLEHPTSYLTWAHPALTR